MPKFILKPRPVEAHRLPGYGEDASEALVDWIHSHPSQLTPEDESIIIQNPRGDHLTASPGDWIVKDGHGNFYPIADHMFTEVYQPLEQAAS